MQRLETFGLLREVDEQNLRVTSVISTGDIARDGMIIDPEGWDFTNYDKNPVVLWMHDDGAPPMARTIEHLAAGDALIGRAEFDGEDPLAQTIFRKIARGFINATSVRWHPKRIELREINGTQVMAFVEQELLEWSFVTIPADPKALIIRSDSRSAMSREELVAWMVQQGVQGLPERVFAGADLPSGQARDLPDEERNQKDVPVCKAHGCKKQSVAQVPLCGDHRDAAVAERALPEDEVSVPEPDSTPAEPVIAGGADGRPDGEAPEEGERSLITPAFADVLARIYERRNRRRSPDALALNALATVTGKSPERLTQEISNV